MQQLKEKFNTPVVVIYYEVTEGFVIIINKVPIMILSGGVFYLCII